jgi:hypothetical protein
MIVQQNNFILLLDSRIKNYINLISNNQIAKENTERAYKAFSS